jgi:hypothetical protein
VPNFWICKNGTVGTSLAPLAHCWHHWHIVGTFFFPDDRLRIKTYTLINTKANGYAFINTEFVALATRFLNTKL